MTDTDGLGHLHHPQPIADAVVGAHADSRVLAAASAAAQTMGASATDTIRVIVRIGVLPDSMLGPCVNVHYARLPAHLNP